MRDSTLALPTTPAEPVPLHPPVSSRSIGAILVDAGRLTLPDAERILVLQQQEALRFGEAGLKLGLLKTEDIAFALSRQYDYPYLRSGESSIATELVAAYNPFSPQTETFRALRSQLLLRWFTGERGTQALAITSPGRGEGRSWLAANLAVMFSQLGERTLLIDADLRNPCQHSLFGVDNRFGLSSLLANRSPANCVRRVASLLDLSVLPAGPQPPNPQELLSRPLFGKILLDMTSEFRIILIDTPAAEVCADAQVIASKAGGAILVARQHHTTADAAGQLNNDLADLRVSVVGTILNSF